MEIVVGVAREGQRREAGRLDLDAELLAQFSDQRVLRPLPVVDTCRRETPTGPRAAALRPLGDEHAAVDVDQRSRHDEQQPHER